MGATGPLWSPTTWDKAVDSEAGECQREGVWQTLSTRPSSLLSLWGVVGSLLGFRTCWGSCESVVLGGVLGESHLTGQGLGTSEAGEYQREGA